LNNLESRQRAQKSANAAVISYVVTSDHQKNAAAAASNLTLHRNGEEASVWCIPIISLTSTINKHQCHVIT